MPFDAQSARRIGDDLVKNAKETAFEVASELEQQTRQICKDFKGEFRTKQGIKYLEPSDKKSSECMLKAIEKLLPQADGVKSRILNGYRSDLKRNFKI